MANKNYFLSPSALTITPNSLGTAKEKAGRYVYIAIAAGARVRLASRITDMEGNLVLIGYNASLDHYDWDIRGGGGFVLDEEVDAVDVFIYLRIPKDTNQQAGFLFSPTIYDIIGKYAASASGNEILQLPGDYYYVRIARLALESDGLRSVKDIDTGELDTDQGYDNSQWFELINQGTDEEPIMAVRPLFDFAIGTSLVSFDDKNNAVKVESFKRNASKPMNFYATGGVSAFGIGNGGSGSGGSGDGTNVVINPLYDDGTAIAEFILNGGTPIKIFAPDSPTDIDEKVISAALNDLNERVGGGGGITELPEGILTKDNYGTYLNDVYQPKGNYLTSSALTEYATKSWVEGSYATAEWVKGKFVEKTDFTEAMRDVLSHWHIDVNGHLYTDLAMYSTQGISAYGYNAGGEITVNIEQLVTESSNATPIAKINGTTIYAPKYASIGEVDLDDYALKSWVTTNFIDKDGLSSYATKSWVNEQGFLKSYTETDPVFTSSAAHDIQRSHLNVLSHLFIDADGNLYTDKPLYSTQGISAYGYNGGSDLGINIVQKVTDGVEIASINNISIFAPKGGADVVWNQSYTNGVQIATIAIGSGEPIKVYAPTAGEAPDLSGYATEAWVRTFIGQQPFVKKDGSVMMEDYLKFAENKGIRFGGGDFMNLHGTDKLMPWYGIGFFKDDANAFNTHIAGYGGICLHTGSGASHYVRIYDGDGGSGKLRIGDAVLTYDATNKALRLYSATSGVNMSFYASGGISAYGLGNNQAIENLTLTNTLISKDVKVSGKVFSDGNLLIMSGEDVAINDSVIIENEGKLLVKNGGLELGDADNNAYLTLHGVNINNEARNITITNVYVSGSYLCLTLNGVNKRISITNNTSNA